VARLKRVQAFAADLPQGSRILDVGCGNGLPATRELALRQDVTGVDTPRSRSLGRGRTCRRPRSSMAMFMRSISR
jgi:SAM-dependent methyltransferase